MSDEQPRLPDGLLGEELPDDKKVELPAELLDQVDTKIIDLRGTPRHDSGDVFAAVALAVEAEIDTHGWDQKDHLAVVYVDPTGALAAIWLADIPAPPDMKGNLAELLPAITGALYASDGDDLKQEILDPEGSAVGVMASFEAWSLPFGTTGYEPGKLDEHPDRVDMRHVLLCLHGTRFIHVMRRRGGEPELTPIDPLLIVAPNVVAAVSLLSSRVTS